MKIGDRVVLRLDFAASLDALVDRILEPSTVVKSISEGGTVITKGALDGRRCFKHDELLVIHEFAAV